MIVYMLKNKVNGKCYIGVTKGTLKRRITTHFANARKGRTELLYNAIRKYGQDNFEYSVLASSFTIEQLYELERLMISQFNSKLPNGYNMNDGGEGSHGFKFTPEQREAHSKRLKEYHANMTPEKKLELAKTISNSKIGMEPLPHMFDGSKLKGIKRSDEFKTKVSIGMKDYVSTLDSNEMSRRAKSKKEV